MADELKGVLGVKSELVRSSGGIFEVEFGGDSIFSKKKLGRFPDEGEVVKLLKNLRGGA